MQVHDRSPILLFPGIFGKERSFTDLCDALRSERDTLVVRYPGATASTELLLDIPASAAFVASRLRTAGPDEPALIVGYSYGANLAFEVAGCLQAAGRHVALLVLLDPALPMTDFDIRRQGPASASQDRGSARPDLIYRSRALRVALAALSHLVTRRARRRWERRTLWVLRAHARRTWTPHRIDCPVLHVMTRQFAPAVADGWLDLCSDIAQVVVEGQHVDLLKGAALFQVVELVSSALRDAALHGGLRPRRFATAAL